MRDIVGFRTRYVLTNMVDFTGALIIAAGLLAIARLEATAGASLLGTLAGATSSIGTVLILLLAKAPFAVVSYATPAGAPGSSGVLYTTVGRRLYVAVAPDSWKARHIAISRQVAVTVPVRRGGVLFPLPPATISFHATVIVHTADSPEASSLPKELEPLLPAERRASSTVIEIVPEGRFVTYGIGVSLMQMRDPAAARAFVPVR